MNERGWRKTERTGGVDPGMKRSEKPVGQKGGGGKMAVSPCRPSKRVFQKERKERGELINKSCSQSDGSRASIVR